MKNLCRVAALAVTALAGCAHEPRVSTAWANRAREVCSRDTPREKVHKVRADFGPADDRDDARLADLSGEPDLGEVVVSLGEGVYQLEAFTRLDGATSVVIEGEGAHKTRLEMDTDTSLGLAITRCPRVTLRGLTLVGLTGGGIGVRGGEVVVEDCVFAAAACGLALDEHAVARVTSSVFAGCSTGVDLSSGSRLIAREVAFDGCWVGIGGRGDMDLAGCAFFDGHDAIKAPIAEASIQSTLFAGDRQLLGFTTRPRIARALLVPVGFIQSQQDRHDFREIATVDDFPSALRAGIPTGFDIAAVHLAIKRARDRGDEDPPAALRDLAKAQSRRHAELARDAMTSHDLENARREAALALAYWRAYPLSEGPDVLAEVAGLVQ